MNLAGSLTTMPLGKYRGTLLGELPPGYLDWLGSKLDTWREPFHSALAAEITRRKGNSTSTTANGATPASARQARTTIRRPTAEHPASVVCDVCALGLTGQRPLVHASCLNDEVPF